METVVEKTEEIKVSEGDKWTELKQDVGEEKDVLLHETMISVASIPVGERKEEAISMSREQKGNWKISKLM